MLLDEIVQINKDRSSGYGHPLPNHLRISLLWSVKHAPFLYNPVDVAEMMIMLKEARNINDTKWDNYRDEMGYTNVIDLMCQLYFDIKKQQYTKYDLLKEGYSFYTDNSYTFLIDIQKEKIVNELKLLSFGQQYDLLNESIHYLNELKYGL